MLAVTRDVVPNSPILVTLMMEATRFSKRRFLQELRGVTSQKMAFYVRFAQHHPPSAKREMFVAIMHAELATTLL
jgi:hypothetical protein